MTQVNNNTAQNPRFDASEVGWLFVQEYYTFMNREPARLHCFYNKKSTFVHGHEGEQAVVCHGQQEIHQRIMDLGLNNCKVIVSNVDTQASANNGIVVQVIGEMSNNGGPSHKFSQTFFLAEQPNGFFVLNDIFRFMKEDISAEVEEKPTSVPALAPKPIVQEQFVQKKPAQPNGIKDSWKKEAPAAVPVVPVPVVPVADPVVKAPVPAPVVKAPVADPVPVPTTTAAPATAVATSAVAKPKTWANLAATNVDKFAEELSPAKGQVLNQPKEKKKNAKKVEEKEKFSVYIKGLADGTTEKMISEAFSKVGAIISVDILPNRNIAFVEYEKVEFAEKAIGQTFVVNGAPVIAEERRKNRPQTSKGQSQKNQVKNKKKPVKE